MSDVGKYDALEAEVTALINGTTAIPGVISVNPSLSMRDLARDGIRKPGLGIVVLPTQFKGLQAVGYRPMRVTTRVVIAVAIQTGRTAVLARKTLYTIFETLHDRVHYAASALPPGARYLFDSEVSEEQEDKSLLLGQAVYQLDLLMAQ